MNMRPEKRRVPEFKRQEWWRHRALGRSGWRKPRGHDSKMRLQKKGKPPIVKVGYRQPKAIRGLHPSGFKEVLVRNLKDLEKVDPSREAVRLSATLGKRKREQILAVVKERGIKVLNP